MMAKAETADMAGKFIPLLLAEAFFGTGCVIAPALAQEVVDTGETEYSSSEHPLAVEQDYDPRPAIWRIADEDTTIYLFGTFHILPEGFRWRTPLLNQISSGADELVLETTRENSDGSEQMLSANEFEELIANRTLTSANLSSTNIDKWKSLAAQSGFEYADFDRLPIFLSMAMLALGHLESMGSSELYGVEPSLEDEFRRMNRPIQTIEDSATVLIKVLKLDEKPMIAELDEKLTAWNGENITDLIYGPAAIYGGGSASSEAFSAEHAWAKGDGLGDLDWGDSDIDHAIRKILLTDRNNAWSNWLDDRMDRPGNILVAVGAGHFKGEDSVIALLEQRGFKVDRVQ